MLSLEDAPFSEYLKILRKEGFEEDAEISEVFYVETLKPHGYSENQIYKTSFKNLVQAVELILEAAKNEVMNTMPPLSISGTMLKGRGAENLTDEQLHSLMRHQIQLHEEEKARLAR